MIGTQYLKNQLPVLLLNILGMVMLGLFLLAAGNSLQTVLLIGIIWMMIAAAYLTIVYFVRQKRLNRLMELTEQLEERYLILEIMTEPERAEEQVYYQILKMAEKSMLERIGAMERERKAYREYIEQWIHEVKTPITAIKLLCENNRSAGSRTLLAELEQINRFTEQALYYARSGHTDRDYVIREIHLSDVVHSAIADNRYLLRQSNFTVTVEDMERSVYTDDKWVRFLLNQLISNAVKYRAGQPALRFFATEQPHQVQLSVQDNGMGIPTGDLPRIFDKGFTGQNGRAVPGSTGIGLYLCKRLCDKLGIGLTAHSDDTGTTMTLTFPINEYITGVQG